MLVASLLLAGAVVCGAIALRDLRSLLELDA